MENYRTEAYGTEDNRVQSDSVQRRVSSNSRSQQKPNPKRKFIGFWLKSIEQEFLIILGTAVGIVIYGLLTSSHMSIEDVLNIMPGGIVGLGTVMIGAFTIANSNQLVNIAISMGSTRRETFCSMLGSLLILAAQLWIIYLISVLFIGRLDGYGAEIGAVFAGTLLGAIGVGEFGMGIYRRFGGGIVVVYVIGVIALLAGAIFLLNIGFTTIDALFNGVKVLIPAVGAIVFLLGSMMNYIHIMKMEVKW